MRAEKILFFVLLLDFISSDALARDFSAVVNKTGKVVSGVGVQPGIRSSRGPCEVTLEHPFKTRRVSGISANGRSTPAGSQILTELRRNGSNSVRMETRTPDGALGGASLRLNRNGPDPAPPSDPLVGYVDLHTHPLANVGFGGQLLSGGGDIGSLLPAGPNCSQNV